jgi:hypothetical protein
LLLVEEEVTELQSLVSEREKDLRSSQLRVQELLQRRSKERKPVE